jgi:hypothetical protein
MTNIRQIEKDDLDYLKENITNINRKEIDAMFGMNVKEWFEQADYAFDRTVVLENEEGIIGFGGSISGGGRCLVWVMATNLIFKYSRDFFRAISSRFEELKKTEGYIYSNVFSENKMTKIWLRKMGFTIHDPEEMGVKNGLFHRFDWERS